MPERKPSAAKLLEALLEEYASQGESVHTSTVSPPPLRSHEALPAKDLKPEERKNIIEVVEADEGLLGIVRRMTELNFLLPGIFHPLAYLRDTNRIEAAWRRSKSMDTALAMGMHLYNDFFFEGVNATRSKGNFTVSRETRASVRQWEKAVKKLFPTESSQIVDAARKIGQYLEFRNRRSQGF
jgi:hypothetical protein